MGRAPRIGAALLATAVAAAIAVQAPPARAAEDTTPPVSVTLPVRATPWASTVTLPRFDPALGELRSVLLTVDVSMSGTIELENLDPDDKAELTARAAATVSVSRPAPASGTLAAATAGVTRTEDLNEHDGVRDYDGDSGVTRSVADDHEATTTLTATNDLALFTGLSPVTLPAAGADASTEPSGPDVDARVRTQAGAVVTVVYTYVSDTRPPDPPTILTSPSAFTASPAPQITFTAEPGAVTECQLTTPAGTGPWQACSSPWVGDLTATGDGSYTFAVRATDAAGNVGTPSTRTFVLDRVAPAQPTLTFALLGPVPLLGRWTFTIEPGATARCSLDGAAFAPCTSPHTVDLGPLSDGDHTLTVYAMDPAGNQGPSASSTHTLDRDAPDVPTITSTPPSPSHDPTPTWTFTLAPEAASATCAVDGGTPLPCSSPFTADLSAAADGTHTLAVRNADAAGNVSDAASSSYVLDRAAPPAPIVVGPPTPGNGTTVSWSIAVEAGATAACRLDAGTWSPCADRFTTTFGAGSDGLHVLTVRATDAAGNVGPETVSAYTLDTVAPAAPVIVSAPPSTTNDAQPTWTFTVEPSSQAICQVDAGAWVPCTSPFEADLTAAAEGAHTFRVRATDLAGNVGATTTDTFTLDLTAPSTPEITGGPPSHGSAPTVTFTFTSPPGTTAFCRINSGSRTPCTSPFTVTFGTDARHRLRVDAVDEAGNISLPAEAFYTLDRVPPPAPTITSAPASPAQLTTPRWTFSLPSGSQGECSMGGGRWVACDGSFTSDLSGAPDGTHTFAVRAVDTAGNVGPAATSDYSLDRTPPPVPVILSGPAPHTADDTPTWSFSVEGGAMAQCRVDDSGWVPCRDSHSADLTAEPDGTHALEVRAVDTVGNASAPAVSTYVLDRQAPAPATFTTLPASPGRDLAPVWAFTAEPGTSARCTLDGEGAVPCDGTFTASLSVDGTHTLTVVLVDAAGNVSPPATTTYELDTAAPGPPTVLPPRSPDRDRQPEWLITVDPDAVALCSFDGGAPSPCAGAFAVDLAADGAHTLVVVARDAAGNESSPATSTYVLDTVAPVAPSIQHTPDAASWTWRFSVEAGASAECALDGNPWAACTSPMAGGTPGRTVRFEVRAVDRAGNRSPVTRVTITPTLPTPVTPPSPPAPAAPTPPSPDTPAPLPTVAPDPTPAARPAVARTPGQTIHRDLTEAEGDASAFQRPPMVEESIFTGPVAELLGAAAESSTIPVLVILVVLAFVAVQNRIDRMDPKLADLPVRHEPEYLEFE